MNAIIQITRGQSTHIDCEDLSTLVCRRFCNTRNLLVEGFYRVRTFRIFGVFPRKGLRRQRREQEHRARSPLDNLVDQGRDPRRRRLGIRTGRRAPKVIIGSGHQTHDVWFHGEVRVGFASDLRNRVARVAGVVVILHRAGLEQAHVVDLRSGGDESLLQSGAVAVQTGAADAEGDAVAQR